MKKFIIVVMILFLLCIKNEVYAYDSYKVGDKVEYNGEYWHVIKDSNEDINYVSLLKAKVFNSEQVKKYVNNSDLDINGAIDYYSCSVIQSIPFVEPGDDCKNDYEGSIIKMIIENWANDVIPSNDLIEDENGYKVRLLTVEDLINNFTYELQSDMYGSFYGPTNENLSRFLYEARTNLQVVPFWLSTPVSNDYLGDKSVYQVKINGRVEAANVVGREPAYVRPVITVKKEVLEENDEVRKLKENVIINKNEKVCRMEKKKVPIFPKYTVGDVVTYNNEQYLVIENSNSKKNYVALLRINALTDEEVSKYYEGAVNIDDTIGAVEYSNVDGAWRYNESNVKTIIDRWAQDKFNPDDLSVTNPNINSPAYLYSDGGSMDYDAQMLGYSKYTNVVYNCGDFGCIPEEGEDYNPTLPTPSWFNKYVAKYIHSNSTPSWLYDSNYDYWFYSGTDVTVNSHYIMGRNGDIGLVGESHSANGDLTGINGISRAAVRPTINVFKTALSENRAYSAGEIVSYQGMNFIVLENSPASEAIVKLLKQTPLTQGEVNRYLNVSQASYDANDIQYKSGCIYFGECSADYDNSDVKKVVDAWAQDNLDLEKLVEVKGYKVRLITIDDLIENLGFINQKIDTHDYFIKTEDTPVQIYESGEKFWTMNRYEDSDRYVYFYSDRANSIDVDSKNKIRPVINLYKCELGSCEYEEMDVEVCDPEQIKPAESLIVAVGNTLKEPSVIILILSIILIACGIVAILRLRSLNKMNK